MASLLESDHKEKGEETADEGFSVELPAPPGWKKKYSPKKAGTPRKNEVTFTSPTGMTITDKKQLDLYLKANPGGPISSEFDWGTGETPRRSARISEKTKAIPLMDSSPKKKRSRTLSAPKKESKVTEELADTNPSLEGEETVKDEGRAVDDNCKETVKDEQVFDDNEKVDTQMEDKPSEKFEIENETNQEEPVVTEKPECLTDVPRPGLERDIPDLEVEYVEGSDTVNANLELNSAVPDGLTEDAQIETVEPRDNISTNGPEKPEKSCVDEKNDVSEAIENGGHGSVQSEA